MGFKVKHGGPASLIKLAEISGAGQLAQKQSAVALDIAMNLRAEQQRAAMAEFSAELEMNMRQQQMQFDAQKFMVAQQNDFQMQENIRMQNMEIENQKKLQKQNEYDALIEAIDNNDTVNDAEKEKFKLNAQAKYSMGAYAPQIKDDSAAGMKAAQGMMKMQRDMENDLVFYQDIINGFSTTADTNWVPFSAGRGAGDLAKKDDDGKWQPATEQDKAMYDYAKMQMAFKMQQLTGAGTGPGATGGGPGDVLGLGGI